MHIRIDPEIKSSVEPILDAIGLSFSDVFNLMLHQIALKHRIPFELSSARVTENGFTPEFETALLAESDALRAAIADGTAKAYRSSADMFAEWDKEDAENNA
jgi:addiction module RelB/DinJ family antitoxin